MQDIVFERMLTDYYKTCLAVGQFADREKIFDVFVRIYNVEPSKVQEIKAICNASELSDLTNEQDCNLYSRSCEILRIRRQVNPLPSLLQQLIAIRINAIRQLSQEGLCAPKCSTVMQLRQTLDRAAQEGVVDALRIGGLLTEEKLLPFSGRNGLEWINKAASWLDYTSLLYLMERQTQARTPEFDCVSTLQCACDYFGPSFPRSFNRSNCYGGTSRNGYLLLAAAKNGKINFSKIDPIYFNIIYAHTLTESDKERLIMRQEYSEAELALLPTNLCDRSADTDVFARYPSFFRKEERKRISELHANRGQSTICIKSNDVDVLDKFEEMIFSDNSDGYGKHIELIDVAKTNSADFDRTLNNIFLRGCINGLSNIFILRICGYVPTEILQEVCEFLSAKSQYKLTRPNVVLDLSKILVYCLCDDQNAKVFSHVPIVDASPMTVEEKNDFIRETEKINCQLRENVTHVLSDEMVKILCKYSLKTAEAVVRELLRSISCEEELSMELFEDILQKHSKISTQNNYGFGGYKQ